MWRCIRPLHGMGFVVVLSQEEADDAAKMMEGKS